MSTNDWTEDVLALLPLIFGGGLAIWLGLDAVKVAPLVLLAVAIGRTSWAWPLVRTMVSVLLVMAGVMVGIFFFAARLIMRMQMPSVARF